MGSRSYHGKGHFWGGRVSACCCVQCIPHCSPAAVGQWQMCMPSACGGQMHSLLRALTRQQCSLLPNCFWTLVFLECSSVTDGGRCGFDRLFVKRISQKVIGGLLWNLGNILSMDQSESWLIFERSGIGLAHLLLAYNDMRHDRGMRSAECSLVTSAYW